MAYQKSRARKTFESELLRLLSAARHLGRSTLPSDTQSVAFGGVILMCSARIEDYLEDLIEDWGKALSAGVLCGSLPLNTRAFFLNARLEEPYRKLVSTRDEMAFLSEVSNSLTSGQMDYANAAATLIGLNVRAIYERVKYPSPKNMRKLFFRLGIDKIFHKLNASARKDVELDLTSFNDLRTELAHTGNPVPLTDKDVRRHLVLMSNFVKHLDRIFYAHVIAVNGPTAWTT